MRHGRFDADTVALEARIRAHEEFGAADLNQWVFDHLDLAEGQHVLDIGCGTGKQTLPMAEQVAAGGRVVAVDISEEAVAAVREGARAAGLHDRLQTMCANLDNIADDLHGQRFDRVLACYSLYYASAPERVFATVHELLWPGGVFFFCGPSARNNRELKDFQAAIKGEARTEATPASVFMEQTGPALARELFWKVEIFTFENPLRFDSAEALHGYWKFHNLYEEALEASFKASAAVHFHTHAVFETVKRVTGIRATKAAA